MRVMIFVLNILLLSGWCFAKSHNEPMNKILTVTPLFAKEKKVLDSLCKKTLPELVKKETLKKWKVTKIHSHKFNKLGIANPKSGGQKSYIYSVVLLTESDPLVWLVSVKHDNYPGEDICKEPAFKLLNLGYH